MPIATDPAARTVASADHARRMADAKARRTQAAADLAAQRRADTLTPLGSTPAAFAVETLPDPPLRQAQDVAPLFADVPDAPTPAEMLRAIGITPVATPNPQPPSPIPQAAPRSITLSSSVLYRDYTITISAGGLTLATFGALLSGALGELALPFRVTVEYGGRDITIEADGLTLDRLCDMLDQRLRVVQ